MKHLLSGILIVAQLEKKFPLFLEPEISLPYLHVLAKPEVTRRLIR
jgi:hypothetical protein